KRRRYRATRARRQPRAWPLLATGACLALWAHATFAGMNLGIASWDDPISFGVQYWLSFLVAHSLWAVAGTRNSRAGGVAAVLANSNLALCIVAFLLARWAPLFPGASALVVCALLRVTLAALRWALPAPPREQAEPTCAHCAYNLRGN